MSLKPILLLFTFALKPKILASNLCFILTSSAGFTSAFKIPTRLEVEIPAKCS